MTPTSHTALSISCTPQEPRVPGRRAALQALTGAAAVLALGGLGGCGFALRQPPRFVFDTLRIAGSENSPVSRALQRALVSSGLRVINTSTSTPTQGATEPAQAVLSVVRDQQERVVAGQTDSGQVREMTLRTRFHFSLSTPTGKLLLGTTELLLERDISFSETNALAKAAEERIMFSDMEGDIVQQVLRRLAAVKSL
jgi:LPS-assembly lipoprotein